MLCIDDVEELIDAIEDLNPVDYGEMDNFEKHEGARWMKEDIIKIIEEHCGVAE